MDINIVFNKIRELSAESLNPRPFISAGALAQELHIGVDQVMPSLLGLKKMRLIIFDKKIMTAFKLTNLGLHWQLMPR